MRLDATFVDEVFTRTRVLVGESSDTARRGNKTLVAKSECQFICPDDATLSRCVEQLRQSDVKLRQRPADMMLWAWQDTFVEKFSDREAGGIVSLGVAWYDASFFEEKKDAYCDPLHLAKYLDIGIPAGNITVTHWKLAGSGRA